MFEKAAALTESIIRRHPFVDGNKRTGISSGAYLLSTFELTATNEELEELAVAVATGSLTLEQMAQWLEDNSREV